MRPLIWIFEDQLTPELPSLLESPDAPVLLIESAVNFRRVPFHKKRIAFLCSAMRHFAEELRKAGRTVLEYPLKSRGYRDSVSAVRHALKQARADAIWIVEPTEHHTRQWLESLEPSLGVPIRWMPNSMFLLDRDEFADWARSKKSPVMEFFYRNMRVKHGVLMDPANPRQPIGGTWNLDAENRKPAPRNLLVPSVPQFKPDDITRAVLKEVERRFPDHPGSTDGFAYPVTRADARAALADFLQHRLPLFGDFEDAMVTGQPVLFHSMLSPALNAGLLTPMECIRAAEARYHAGKAPLNATEGFVRQILGWREYVYGIYWTFMPEYRQRNTRKSTRPLPRFFWDGNTDLNCLKQTVGGLLDHAYTHHIQRLMVLCNFATLAGLSPQAVNDWFYAMYADSHDWVVTPNVVGMGMNADHGTIATKPYVSSAAYIDRMSDYCTGCRYNPKARTGDDACPFNYLYWTFLSHYRKDLGRNPRISMLLKNLDRFDPSELRQMMLLRKQFIESLEAQAWSPEGFIENALHGHDLAR
jgi:deoxyribodipyrimidine photolyase-related protein